MYGFYITACHDTGDRPCVNDPLDCVKAMRSPDRLCRVLDGHTASAEVWEVDVPDDAVFVPTEYFITTYHPDIDFSLLFYMYGHNPYDVDEFFDLVFSRRRLTGEEKRELCKAMEWDIENLDWHVDHARLCVAAALGYAAVKCGDSYLMLTRRIDDFGYSRYHVK